MFPVLAGRGGKEDVAHCPEERKKICSAQASCEEDEEEKEREGERVFSFYNWRKGAHTPFLKKGGGIASYEGEEKKRQHNGKNKKIQKICHCAS